MKKSIVSLFCCAALTSALAQDAADARAAYQDRQALAEVPRLLQQFEVLANNQEQIAARLVKVESGTGDVDALRAEVANLQGQIAELRAAVRKDQDAMRREIVEDLARRLGDISGQMQKNQSQSLAQIQARAEAALQQAEAAAKAAREQAAYTQRNSSRATAPRASGGGSSKPAAPAYSGPYYEHVVESGQTLSFIAKGFDTTVQKILDANPGLKPNALQVGQKLIIPAEDQAASKKK